MISRKIELHEGWKIINDIAELASIDERSKVKPVVIFKHSTTCGISAGAHHRLDSNWDDIAEDVEMYYLDLLNYRSISNAIADHYGVHHQSPQILVIKSGKVVYHTSHHEVSAEVIGEHLVKAV